MHVSTIRFVTSIGFNSRLYLRLDPPLLSLPDGLAGSFEAVLFGAAGPFAPAALDGAFLDGGVLPLERFGKGLLSSVGSSTSLSPEVPLALPEPSSSSSESPRLSTSSRESAELRDPRDLLTLGSESPPSLSNFVFPPLEPLPSDCFFACLAGVSLISLPGGRLVFVAFSSSPSSSSGVSSSLVAEVSESPDFDLLSLCEPLPSSSSSSLSSPSASP
mmetsp:Transcript_25313/g.67143  ORF Transcript_25313/g.67143 Transcript_25313/m.67143 type:complete len:217 (-) Transcript_25313:408-1058(-)